jgi:hypothetical protein
MTRDLESPRSQQLAAMSVLDLRRELSSAIGLTAQAISRVATIWDELTRRGEDLSDVRFALRDYMRAIAAGRLMPEAVAMLAGNVRTLNLVAALPLVDQHRLVVGDTIDIATSTGTVSKKLSDLTFQEASRSIRNGQILTVSEQSMVLQRATAALRRPRAGRPHRVSVNTETGEIKIGTISLPIDRVTAALRAAGIKV